MPVNDGSWFDYPAHAVEKRVLKGSPKFYCNPTISSAQITQGTRYHFQYPNFLRGTPHSFLHITPQTLPHHTLLGESISIGHMLEGTCHHSLV